MHLNTERLLQAMADAATRLGVTIRWEKGNFRGGRCVIAGTPVAILNRSHPAEAHLSVLASVLKELPLDTIYLKPAVREDITALIARL